MVTKGIIRSVNRAGNSCIVEMPLFQTAASTAPVTAEAFINITPGMYNNLFVGDIVFIAFEENALEKPIIIGKLFKNAVTEEATLGGAGVLDTLKVKSAASIPASTLFVFPQLNKNEYENLKTPKKMADYIKWLEKLTKKFISQVDNNFKCFKNWVQWQLKPENVEIDDGDIDDKNYVEAVCQQYQKEGDECKICGKNCVKNKTRNYIKPDLEKSYPNV